MTAGNAQLRARHYFAAVQVVQSSGAWARTLVGVAPGTIVRESNVTPVVRCGLPFSVVHWDIVNTSPRSIRHSRIAGSGASRPLSPRVP